jgi:hypothetical protein
MPVRPNLKQDSARQIIERMPEVASKTLGRRLLKERPDLYDNLNQAYSLVRYLRGAKGEKNNRSVKTGGTGGKYLRPHQTPQSAWDALPKGKVLLDWAPLQIAGNRILLLSDIHVPYHDDSALRAALDYGRQQEVDTIVLNGDVCDFHSVSRWETDPKERDLMGELKAVYQLLVGLRQGFPKARILWKGGNHEERLEHYMWSRAPELVGMPISSWSGLFQNPKAFGAEEYPIGVEFIDSLRPMAVDHLWILHGHEFGKSTVFNPVNAARGSFMRAYECLLVAHSHQTSEHTTRTISDRIIACWSMGCLCNLHPKYAPINWRWNHGFAMITRDESGWRCENKKIVNGKVY